MPWVRRVAAIVRENEFLAEAAAALFDPGDFEAGEDPAASFAVAELGVSAERFAFQILHSDALAIERAFEQLLQAPMTAEDRTRLAKLIIPSWVPAESAKAILAAAGSVRPRIVTLRARQHDTPEHAIRKATCSDIRHDVVPPKSLKTTTENPPLELAARYRDDVLQRLGVDRRSPSAAADMERSQQTFELNGKRMFVVLGGDAIDKRIGPELWGDTGLDHPVYVLADEREAVGAETLGVPSIVHVEPDVDSDAERDGTTIGARMLKKVETS